MKALVIYDSLYGNTEKVAKAIGSELRVKVLYVKDAKSSDLNGVELLVIGSPTHGGRPAPKIKTFIQSLPPLKGIKAAAFDTRMSALGQSKWLQLIIKFFDFAAPKMEKLLKAKGAKVIAPAEGFIVEGKKGPLRKREIERAKNWARKLYEN